MKQPHTDSSHRGKAAPTAPFSPRALARENRTYRGTGGVSRGNRRQGFVPAFRDPSTGEVYLSRFRDGRLAPLHLLDGLPEEVVAQRAPDGRVTALKPGIVAGFERNGRFYDRQEVARAVAAPKLAS
jgi:hypothetical protein